ncbi:MAG: hypothetical protein Q8S73_09305, partial [Deltaproteobacteria bacterium]|nr:hypothetical protein [Deltaproteobacteria bacterium]
MSSLHLRTLLLFAALCGCGGSSIVGGTTDGGRMDAAAIDVPCAAPQLTCGELCVDPTASAAHCGGCGRSCATGQACVAGACQARCQGTSAVCGGPCRDLQTDGANCGACGRACAAGQMCSLGRCSLSCDASLATCAGGDGGAAAYCADARTDRLNCGA